MKSVFNLYQSCNTFYDKTKEGENCELCIHSGKRGSSLAVHCGASKAGVIVFTKSLAKEVGRYGINVNAITPGIIRTEMTKKKMTEEHTKYLSQIPLGRFGESEDVVGIVQLLFLKEGDYITGQIINVDRGMVLSKH